MKLLGILVLLLSAPHCTDKFFDKLCLCSGQAAAAASVVGVIAVHAPEGKDVNSLCDRFVHCDVFKTKEECKEYRKVHPLPKKCIYEILLYPDDKCPVFSPPYVERMCFPQCYEPGYKCDGNILTICEQKREYRIDCERYCAQKNARGVCVVGIDKGHDDCRCD
jgi:hypothetical protein